MADVSKPQTCLIVYDTCTKGHEPKLIHRIIGVLLGMRYLVQTNPYPGGGHLAYGYTPQGALRRARRVLARKERRRREILAITYPTEVLRDCGDG